MDENVLSIVILYTVLSAMLILWYRTMILISIIYLNLRNIYTNRDIGTKGRGRWIIVIHTASCSLHCADSERYNTTVLFISDVILLWNCNQKRSLERKLGIICNMTGKFGDFFSENNIAGK